MKKAVCLSLLIWINVAWSQQNDSLLPTRDTHMVKSGASVNDAMLKIAGRNEKIRSLKIPVMLISYGFLALNNDNLLALDNSIKNAIREEHPYFRTRMDDYLQYALPWLCMD